MCCPCRCAPAPRRFDATLSRPAGRRGGPPTREGLLGGDDAGVGFRDVAAAHSAGADAHAGVGAAAGAGLEAALGGGDAQFLLDEAEGYELQWSASQEITPLLGGLWAVAVPVPAGCARS